MWDVKPVPDDVPPPTQRHVDQYKAYSDEMKQAYRQKHAQKQPTEVSNYGNRVISSWSIVINKAHTSGDEMEPEHRAK
jgi:hypothetical protein